MRYYENENSVKLVRLLEEIALILGPQTFTGIPGGHDSMATFGEDYICILIFSANNLCLHQGNIHVFCERSLKLPRTWIFRCLSTMLLNPGIQQGELGGLQSGQEKTKV